ncbi:hypothetical protein CYY_002246 [Polysphondylium violaceum]|uniref:E2F/DP family winged-helix DNA-binding domain-containing protein n=1 Tax=Polysphondylium violaceum TaxID=133409 RepID=A0A8J4PX39_9MYCE|nr:hypothetical protein CYY_002246 [Polysphondylium violaceum]
MSRNNYEMLNQQAPQQQQQQQQQQHVQYQPPQPPAGFSKAMEYISQFQSLASPMMIRAVPTPTPPTPNHLISNHSTIGNHMMNGNSNGVHSNISETGDSKIHASLQLLKQINANPNNSNNNNNNNNNNIPVNNSNHINNQDQNHHNNNNFNINGTNNTTIQSNEIVEQQQNVNNQEINNIQPSLSPPQPTTTTTTATTTTTTGKAPARKRKTTAATSKRKTNQSIGSDDEATSGSETTTTTPTTTTATGKRTRSNSNNNLNEEKSNNRYDNSLVQLTKKFLGIIKNSPQGILDLKVASDKLDISKRRIYDVTCVLEGVGLIEKCSKNQVQWKDLGKYGPTPIDSQPPDPKFVDSHKKEMKKLIEKENALDNSIKKAQKVINQLIQDPKYSKYVYVTHQDLRSIESMKNDTVIAIKAAAGTKLEVPDPDEGMEPPNRRYQIYLTNENKVPIDVFLLSQPTTADTDATNNNSSASKNGSFESAADEMIESGTGYPYQYPNQPSIITADGSYYESAPNPFSPLKNQYQQHQQNQVTAYGANNVSYWEPNSILPSYSPFDDNNQSTQSSHPTTTTTTSTSALSNNPNNPNNQQFNARYPTATFSETMFEQASSDYYFDSTVIDEGISELYTDDSFITQSFDGFADQSIDHTDSETNPTTTNTNI